MKTPKRKIIPGLRPEDWPFDPPHHAGDMLARWKRKNRTARLKAKVARLTERNKYLVAELMKTNEYYFNALRALAKKNGY